LLEQYKLEWQQYLADLTFSVNKCKINSVMFHPILEQLGYTFDESNTLCWDENIEKLKQYKDNANKLQKVFNGLFAWDIATMKS
jgi:hypothetical protein